MSFCIHGCGSGFNSKVEREDHESKCKEKPMSSIRVCRKCQRVIGISGYAIKGSDIHDVPKSKNIKFELCLVCPGEISRERNVENIRAEMTRRYLNTLTPNKEDI